jgi:DNA-binding SARP family transcriptional activator
LKKKKYSTTCKDMARAAIAAMKLVVAYSDWNFTNKLRLLEAEYQSTCQCHKKSVAMYDASIESAKRSGFIHEQGLACEKAGFYFKRENEKEKALEYFTKARECYEEWGSIMKVDSIQKELDSLRTK